jgi:MbtH protein
MPLDEDNRAFNVVVNHEEQYSIWPTTKKIPEGWREAGFSGKKDECLAHIDAVWTDMRPLSLRRRMAEQQGLS